jgi:methionyl-tRNA formyltransferase
VLGYSSRYADRAGYTDIAALATTLGIASLAVDDINGEIVRHAVDQDPLELLVVAGWSQIVASELLARFRLGGVGVHPTLLPNGKGRAPIPWTLIKGLHESGTTLFRLEQLVDSGDIIGQVRYTISEEDDAWSLYAKVAASTEELLVRHVPDVLSGTAVGRPQANRGEMWPRRKPEDGRINWESQTGREIYDWVRGLTRPYPGAFTSIKGTKLTVWSADFAEGLSCVETPGSILGAVLSVGGSGVAVASKDGEVVILREIQLEGEDPMFAARLITGQIVAPGDCFD